MTKIIDIEGVGPVYAAKLGEAGVKTVEALLKTAATRAGRKALAEKSGIREESILEWTNRADLFRIKGVGEEYSDLLENAGVDTVPELAHRKAESLYAKLIEVNTAKKLVRQAPSQAQVASWIEQAKKLPRAIDTEPCGDDAMRHLGTDCGAGWHRAKGALAVLVPGTVRAAVLCILSGAQLPSARWRRIRPRRAPGPGRTRPCTPRGRSAPVPLTTPARR